MLTFYFNPLHGWRSRIFVVGSPGCLSGLSSLPVTIQLSSGALLVCLRPSLAASTFLTCPDIGALCPEWASLHQISMSLLGFIIIGIVVFTVIALAPSHFISMHIVSLKEIRCLVPNGKRKPRIEHLSLDVKSSDTAFFLGGCVFCLSLEKSTDIEFRQM